MTRILGTTPRQDGFRMPGEYEFHERCWMLWPHRTDNWRDRAMPAQKAFARVARAISRFEPVTMCVSKQQIDIAQNLLPSDIDIIEIESDDAWMRDVGPIFVKNDTNDIRGVDWDFNAWGGLNGGVYFPWDKDGRVARQVLEHEKIDRYKACIILEGGSIHTDGDGTLITTQECLLNPNRNPDLSKAELENYLKEYLNIEKIIWLDKGVFMDETDGHVDNLCCFVKPGEVLLHWTDDPSDPQYEISCDAFDILLKDHKCLYPLPHLGVGHSDHAGADDGLVLLEDAFDLRGRHPVALVLDGVLGAVHEVEIALLVGAHHVRGAIVTLSVNLHE